MVSVIIPVYNVKDYIDKCMYSVVNQTFKNLEIILINDGSTDGSDKKCIEWAEKDARIIYVSKKNEGQGAARNLGIKMAKSEYITFIDSDDWWNLTAVEKMYAAIEEHHADMVACGRYEVVIDKESGKENLRFFKIWAESNVELDSCKDLDLIYKLGFALWSKMYRKSLFLENNILQPPHKYEDIAVIPLLVAKSKIIYHIEEPLYYYWINRNDSTVNYFNSLISIKQSLEKIKNDFDLNGLFDKYYSSLKRTSFVSLKTVFYYANRLKEQTSQQEYHKLKKQLFDFMDTNYPDWINTYNLSFGVWGSYNLRRVVMEMMLEPEKLEKYFGFSSLISICSPNKNLKHIKLEHSNKFREKMLYYDFKKVFFNASEEISKLDYIFIDFLEERFEIARYKDTYFTKSDAFDQINDNLAIQYQVLKRSDNQVTELWKEKCLEFIVFLKQNFEPHQVVLIRNKLAEYYGEYSTEKPYDNIEEIRHTNILLDEYYDFFEFNYCGISVLNMGDTSLNFTDKNFIHGCCPHHLNEMYYLEAAHRALDILSQKKYY